MHTLMITVFIKKAYALPPGFGGKDQRATAGPQPPYFAGITWIKRRRSKAYLLTGNLPAVTQGIT